MVFCAYKRLPESSNENQSDRESTDEEMNENCAATENCGEERDVTGGMKMKHGMTRE